MYRKLCNERLTKWEPHEYCIRPLGHDFAHSANKLQPEDFKSLKRSPVKRKAKRATVSWRSGKLRLDAEGMKELRIECYLRSEGACENVVNGLRCDRSATWATGEMHHIIHRSRAGSDEISNVIWLCKTCHSLHHLKNLEIVRYGILS